jgi:hypothetical protein
MSGNGLLLVVPAATEALLLGSCLLVWLQLRRLGVRGVCQLTLAAVVVDALGQGWQLWQMLGRPAGVIWLVHVSLSYLMVYIVYRLGRLLGQLQTYGNRRGRALAEEGGQA